MTQLVIFDVDGTIADHNTAALYPHFLSWLRHKKGTNTIVGLATNQGGVGLRHWMETGGFGDPSSLPTALEVRVRLKAISNQIGHILGRPPLVQVCFAYQSKRTDEWSPTPDGEDNNPAWCPNGRKPDIGMIERIKYEAGEHTPLIVYLVGDNEEDKQAALKAKAIYSHPDRFFASYV